MNDRIRAIPMIAAFGCALVLVGCEPEGVGTIGPPKGQPRKDDSFLIPGFDPEAAKSLKKKGKAAQSKVKAEPIDLKDKRH